MKGTLGLLIVCAGLLHAQESTGSITGVVQGPTSATILGARVTLGSASAITDDMVCIASRICLPASIC